jgi:hypothetical protein
MKNIFRLLVIAACLFTFQGLSAQTIQLGTYQGSGCAGKKKLITHEAWLGRKVDIVLDGPSQASWAEAVATTKWLASCWKGENKTLVFSLPMVLADGASNMTAGARGDYDNYFRQVGEALVAAGFGNTIIRIGPEFNAPWFRWSSTKDPVMWRAYWRRIVEVMRQVPGASFRFDWNPIVGSGASSPEPAYPGDDVVDFIGADVYNGNWNPELTPEQRWQISFSAPYGLAWHKKFATAHGKPMTFPEWGTGSRPDGHGGGDDPVFMQKMVDWIKANSPYYHIYWDYPAKDYDGSISNGSQPKAAAIYLKAFGVEK